MNPINPVEIKKDNDEVVSTTADKNAESKVLANSYHDEKKIETEVAVNKEKWKVSLLWVKSVENGMTDDDSKKFQSWVDQDDKKKSWTEKAGDWVREHKNLVWRGAGIGTGLLVYGLFKSRRKKKEAKETKDGKEPGFLKKTRRTLLGIWATLGWWYAAYKIAMWMIDGSKDPNEAKTDDFKKLQEKDPVSAEKYTQLWDATDKTYEWIFKKELDAWWQDDADMTEVSERATGGKDALKWVVPYMLDDKYSSVNDMLSYHGQYMSVLNDSIENISSRIQWLVTWSFGFLKDKFFWLFMKSGDKNKSFLDRINENPKQHAQELKFFVREWVRVQTFLLEKEHHLVEKIAQQKMSLWGWFADVHEAMKDEGWMEKNVYNDTRLTAFRSGKIKGAFDILSKEWLLNGDLTEDTKDIIKDLDADRDEIIWANWTTDDLENLKADLADDGKIEKTSQQNLYKISQAIVKDMDDELLDAMQTTCLSPFADLLNMDDAAKRDFMEKTGMVKCFNDIKMWFSDFATKLSSWQLEPSQIESFIHTVNTYTAWKKEVFIGATTIQQVKGNKDGIADWSVAIGGTWLELMKNTYKGLEWMVNGKFSLNNFWYLFFGGISVYAAGWILYLVNPKVWNAVKIAGKYIAMAWSFPVTVPYKIIANKRTPKIFKWVYRWPAWAIRKMYFDGPNGATKLWLEFEGGKMRLKDAEGIVKSWRLSTSDATKTIWSKEFKDSDNIWRRLIEKKWASELTTNWVVDTKKAQMIADYYDLWNIKDKLRTNFVGTVADLEKIETAKSSLTWSTLELFNKIKSQRWLDFSKLEEMTKKLQSLDEALIQWKDLESLAQKLVKNPDAWKDAASLEIAIKKIKAGKAAPIIDEIHNVERKASGLNLTGDKKALFERTADEINALTSEAESLMATDKKVGRAVAEESRKLKDFAKQIASFNPTEAWDVLKILWKQNWLRLSLKTFVYLEDNSKDIKVILSEIHSSSAAGTLTEDVVKNIISKDDALLKTLEKAGKLDEIVTECMRFGKWTKALKSVVTWIEILAKALKTIR